jgi:hypothetical protein
MTNGEKTITVYVSDEALEDRVPNALDGHMAIFDRHRAEIEQIASNKYDARQIENDGTVLVRSQDLNG